MGNKNQTKKYFIFIESNTTGTGKLFLMSAIGKGYTPLFLTSFPEKYQFLNDECIQPIIIDTKNKEILLEFLQNIPSIIGIFSCSEYYIEIAAYLASKLNLPGNPTTAIENCRNKEKLSDILKSKGFNTPNTWAVENVFTAEKIITTINLPVVIKPTYGTGSIGVKICYTLQEALSHIKRLLSEDGLYSYEINRKRKVLIQEYITGQEYSAETLGYHQTIKLIGVTKKYTGSLPYFLETGHDYPAPCKPKQIAAIEETVQKALTTLQLNLGPAHIEFKIKDDKIYFIEINPRLAGGMIPVLISKVTNIDLIDMTIDIYTGNSPKMPNIILNSFGAIRFIIPQHDGIIAKITPSFGNLNFPVDYGLFKNINDTIEIQGDFRDRIGYVIVTNENHEECLYQVDTAIKSINIELTDFAVDNLANIGRLKSNLHPAAQAILASPGFELETKKELEYQSLIDIAHIKMLVETNLISYSKAKLILDEIRKLKSNDFQEVLEQSNPRGTYLIYENILINKLGINIAGSLHTARSRNDINATIFYMHLRAIYIQVYKAIWALRSQLLTLATIHTSTAFPIYSQYQTALPGTLAHYLLAINETIARDQETLKDLYKLLNVCPLGAGAGGGTTLAIDQNITAKLLGFDKVYNNSLDAVANRDLALRFLANINTIAITVSRFTEDLQLWSTREFGFIDFPDDLCGSSSMMPQKKNPYLLEKIKSMCSETLGTYITSISSMYKVPFANSVEINAGVLKYINRSTHNIVNALNLLILNIKHIEINQDKINSSLINNLTYATYVTEILVKNQKNSLRETHHLVGKIIASHISSRTDPFNELAELIKPTTLGNTPLIWANAMRYGGGPGNSKTKIACAIEQLNIDGMFFRELTNKTTPDETQQ